MNEFDSNRKRMSIILKEIATHKLFLYVKGADANMLPNLEQKNQDCIKNNLNTLAAQGLRTLVYGYKEINLEE